ncbi:MAG: exodeoxyribonuclease V subunit gamma [Kiritimatiellae bacterium]|nr:exodeoxyribonuclease V subunit gamma [Kiritimatiellia bacterium]
MALTISWGNNLERLADDLFAKLLKGKTTPDDLFARRDCVVVPNRTQQAWLQQRFLFDAPRTTVPHVLANCDFPLLSLFVNDWLYRMDHPTGGTPDPEKHPFSVKSMRWQLFERLRGGTLDGTFAPIERYVTSRDGLRRDPRKCFKLAGRLASLLNQYISYRPQMMLAWETGKDVGVQDAPALAWEPALWRMLVETRRDETYLAAFRRMHTDLAACGIEKQYRRIFVFAPSMLPPVHLTFFHHLGAILPVDFYLFNPSEVDWFEREALKSRIEQSDFHELPDDAGELLDIEHPLLSAYARGCRDTAAAALDLTGGQIDDLFAEPTGTSRLAKLQHSIWACDASLKRQGCAPDPSIQVHLCHGKMREVEILRDQLLDCFNSIEGLQPRHIQVQTPDLNSYASYIEAVFSSINPNGPKAIPFVIADRVSAGESQAANAFNQLLNLTDSRFTAPQILELLRNPSIALQFELAPDDVDEAAIWLNKAGVRWGRDAEHRALVTKASFTEETTWGHGLDRLLLGYAMGQEPADINPRKLLPCDVVEGDEAACLGRLVHFYEKLTDFADYGRSDHTAAEWVERLNTLVDDFFLSDNETYRDIAILRRAIRLLHTTSEAAGFQGAVSIAVIRDFLAGHLGDLAGGSDLNRNAVIFTSLRPGSSTPRPVQCLLGMGDGLFPRSENRPAYDLFRKARKMGDRSLPIEDRQAFLEAILNAKNRLLIFYPAFSEEDNSRKRESVAVQELLEYTERHFGSPIEPVHHRLAAHHPSYFESGSPLFSYSESQCETARATLRPPAAPPAFPSVSPLAPDVHVELTDLRAFFDNPAKYYFKNVLGAEPRPRLDALPDEAEIFDHNAMEAWKIREHIIRAIITDSDDDVLATIQADNLLPLAAQGQKIYEALYEETTQLLKQDIAPLPFDKLSAALKARLHAEAHVWTLPISVNGARVVLSGSAPVISVSVGDENIRLILDFSSSSFRYQRLFPTWLTYLLARACNDLILAANFQTESKKEKKEKKALRLTLMQDEVDRPTAISLLENYLRIFLFESTPPPPFVPETSLSYIVSAEGATSDQGKAIRAATTAWSGMYGDARNPYYRALYGKAGPFNNETQFTDWAKRIGQPLQNAILGKLP